ncbi:PREDICTED: IQ motif and SEC7 domain-containing protein 2 isoform X2 [Papilio polytes]|uniref:IQ motif and SEC7 domain-containing protein 2 isoform X2 n=1 Tax=Papilio polytes TaxID=76194 RepID=UPI0006769B3A|nr:PREDICTED: IQ motif and SEC7 domain-containing protein 2 isoform X2 [Papilio polytes]XP_013148898.1 PREDICTED: IQ motif and SEC7 domain-containing protein 2 isoform X2 [Papilio polytes]XP_013148899.1 PREDICTED: IQ motif and SEC7 domain-containing protein 2 isoform X2 [Papilio polytes]
MRIGDLGGALLEAAKLTRFWFCQKPGYGFSQKVDEEESGGGVTLHPPDGFYSHQHSIHSGHHAHNAEPDRGYMEGNRYVTAVHRPLQGLNHSNSSCSSASNASTGAGLCAAAAEPAPPLYIAAPPEGFGLAVHNNRRGTDVGIIGSTGITPKDPSLPPKRGKLTRGRYEMSQDLLDKQVEILERRYGGLRARRAAVTIQRAFRRRQLLKKFSAITAMAKAADSNARRLQDGSDHGQLVNGNDIYANTLLQKSPAGTEKMMAMTRPMRSMSLRERHDVDINNHMACEAQNEAMVEAMVARVQHSAHQIHMIVNELPPHHRNDTDSGVCSCSVSGSVTNISTSSSHNESLHNHQLLNNSGPIYGNLLSSGGKPLSSPSARQQQQLAALQAAARRLPPEVPKRTSSITLNAESPVSLRRAECGAVARGGSMSSVQSSSSSSSQEHRHHYHQPYQPRAPEVHMAEGQFHQRTASGSLYEGERYAVWKRQDAPPYYEAPPAACCRPAHEHVAHQHQLPHQHQHQPVKVTAVSETVRKRQYRVGLNLFNKKPERGIAYLISRGFLENSPRGVARFLITRKGLSKQMIGEYLGNLQNPFNMAVLECFVNELDLSGMAVDVALRRYQAHFRLPGEAQKIERLVEAFARRYCVCNTDFVQRLRTQDTIFVLAFAIIMLNTDLHTPNLKPEARMSLEDFVRNLRGIDDCGDIDRDMLAGIYDRVKASEFRPGSDHVTQVMKVQATIVGKKPHLALPHRRLVCYCRLYEIPDIHKKERPGVHQREVFLFNDLLVITKIFSKKKSSVTYSFRQSFPLCGMLVNLFSVPHYPFGIRLSRRVDGRRLATFNARNEHDRCKFAEDLRESVAEMDEMEAMRIEGELNRGKGRPNANNRNVMENRDSGVADVEIDHQQCMDHVHVHGVSVPPPPAGPAPAAPSRLPQNPPPTNIIKRNVLSNSLVDINDPVALAAERLQRRGSVGSLDSGMSVSFQQGSRTALHATSPRHPNEQRSPGRLFGGIFPARQRKLSASGVPDKGQVGKSTEV